MSDEGLRAALEAKLASLPVMAYDNGYRVQAMPKVDLLDLLTMHPPTHLTDDGEGATPAIDREALEKLIAHWSYDGSGLSPWQEGGGPDPYEAGLDDAATALRKLLDGAR